ncbi:MAG: BON domain-containing protein [Thermoguttaceae bacterium]|jgi:hypothetical protein
MECHGNSDNLLSDRGIVRSAKERIARIPHLTLQRIWCEYDGGTLFLRGQVPSFYYKQLAQEAVSDLDDVRLIANEIEVVW